MTVGRQTVSPTGSPPAPTYIADSPSMGTAGREMREMEREIIGLDITEDANNPKALCADCMTGQVGTLICEGEEWGGDECRCHECGAEIPVALVPRRLQE